MSADRSRWDDLLGERLPSLDCGHDMFPSRPLTYVLYWLGVCAAGPVMFLVGIWVGRGSLS